MPTPHRNALTWPALDLSGRELPPRLSYERGIWGKAHGAPTDFRWLATTPALAAPERHIELDLRLGAADVPDKAATLWRTLGDVSYAVSFYPSRASDAAGRSHFLERQLLEWKRPAEVPAALGALLLLPVAAQLDSSDLGKQRTEVPWSTDDEHPILLTASAPISVTVASIERTVAEGLRALRATTTEEALAELYAAILAGGRAIPLRDLSAPLSPAAMAALLLPLPREVADRLSVAGWLPSSWLSESGSQDLRRCWDIVLGGTTAVPYEALLPTATQLEQARSMASDVYSGDVGNVPTEAKDESKRVKLTLWGPTQAGKTALLAKLYLEADQDAKGKASGWEVSPTQTSIAFFQSMRLRMETDNLFPAATDVGQVEDIEYVFNHPTGATFSLHLEDRAGAESEGLPDGTADGRMSLKERLGSAEGLVLLFDTTSDEGKLSYRVAQTLEFIYLASGREGGRDPRPIAVCVSKADIFVKTPDDFHRALQAPDDFVRSQVQLPSSVLRAFDRRCANYRLFPVSAAGVRLQYGVIEPAVFFDEAMAPRLCPGGGPFNLMAPFTWLLNELTNVS